MCLKKFQPGKGMIVHFGQDKLLVVDSDMVIAAPGMWIAVGSNMGSRMMIGGQEMWIAVGSGMMIGAPEMWIAVGLGLVVAVGV